MSVPTLGDVRRELAKLADLPDDTPLANDVVFGPDEWTVSIDSVEGGVPERWKGVANADEVPNTLWIHCEIVPMED